MRTRFETVAAILLCAAAALAQEPPPAPRETVTATLGGQKVAVEYGRPSLRGRPIGELIAQLPADRIWRAGVDAATTFTTGADLVVGDAKVPAGAYTMYVYAPAEGDWSLVLNRDQGEPARGGTARWPRLGDYDTVVDQEVARVPMRTVALPSPAEMYTVALAPAAAGATMTLSWGDRAYAVDIKPAAPARAQAAPREPRGKVTGMVAGKSVTIDYGRPALKGRTIDALLAQLPEDRMWRAGENQVTTLTTAGPLVIAGKRVPAGTYSMYVHAPAGGPWSLVLNTDKGVPLGTIFAGASPEMKNEPWPHIKDYTRTIAASEVVRAAMTQSAVSEPTDVFTIRLAPLGKGAAVALAWGDQSWSIPIEPGS
jgi:DUF2911 family protein